MSAETLLAGGYSIALLLAAGVIEWLSAQDLVHRLRLRGDLPKVKVCPPSGSFPVGSHLRSSSRLLCPPPPSPAPRSLRSRSR